MRKGLPAIAALFLFAHLFSLPPSLDDIDAVNFALGVRDFDVARHQPHPPGYPLFIALGKAATPVLRAAGVPFPEVRGLACWLRLCWSSGHGCGAPDGNLAGQLAGDGRRAAFWLPAFVR